MPKNHARLAELRVIARHQNDAQIIPLIICHMAAMPITPKAFFSHTAAAVIYSKKGNTYGRANFRKMGRARIRL
jgi:hypothetical protein